MLSRKTGYTKHILRNTFDKTCFSHDKTCADSKDLNKRVFADKILRYKAYEIAMNSEYDGYLTGLISMVFD